MRNTILHSFWFAAICLPGCVTTSSNSEPSNSDGTIRVTFGGHDNDCCCKKCRHDDDDDSFIETILEIAIDSALDNDDEDEHCRHH